MTVYQLMAELAKYPAGARVVLDTPNEKDCLPPYQVEQEDDAFIVIRAVETVG